MSVTQELYQQIATLPPERLHDLAEYVEFLRFKSAQTTLGNDQALGTQVRYAPIKLADLWQGITISDDEIRAVRQTMWAGFGEASHG